MVRHIPLIDLEGYGLCASHTVLRDTHKHCLGGSLIYVVLIMIDPEMLAEFQLYCVLLIIFDNHTTKESDSIHEDRILKKYDLEEKRHSLLLQIRKIDEIYESLPEPERMILKQRFIENMKYAEIGDCNFMSRDTVRREIQRILINIDPY